MHTHRARITTSSPFPLDMLRYDACWPESGQDTVAIEKSLEHGSRKPYTVTVRRNSQSKREAGWTPPDGARSVVC